MKVMHRNIIHLRQSCTLVFTPKKHGVVDYKAGSQVIVSLELSDFLVGPVQYDGSDRVHMPNNRPLSTVPLQVS